MKIAIGADHAGFALKQKLRHRLETAGHEVIDFGPNNADSCDYPDFAQPVARDVAQGRSDRGILVCSTGIGMAMAANKIRGVRAAVCHDEFTAELARAHNAANVIALGARVIGPGVAEAALKRFRTTPFSGGRHQRRIDQITGLER